MPSSERSPKNPWLTLNAAMACALLLIGARPASGKVPEKPTFNQDIRPILSNRCFFCHGPDEKHREGHLRLDLREEALKDHDGERAIVPGKPEESEMIERVLTHDPEDAMPPPKSKRPTLTPEEVATVRRWIEQGAKYEGHWAFLPLRDEAPPVIEPSLPNPIDHFIIARLKTEGMALSPEADRATLIRRVSLDLTGLLPTPEEVAAFVGDAAPDAYERLVDRLLASPHYGERWGRHWLDEARYADSNGYSIDAARAMWPFRDWVIKALNDDLPFDQFTIDQLAGDLLPHPAKSQLIATAFHRNTLINEEGGTKPEQFRVESVLDRANTTGTVWLGLTVGCAQCHSHKFDPIPQREYYQLCAFFNSGEDVNNKGATIEVARGEVFGQAAPAEQQLAEAEAKRVREQPAWEKKERARIESTQPGAAQPAWSVAQYLEYDTASNAGFQLLPDNSLLSDGHSSENDTYRIVAKSTLSRVAAVRLRVLTHDSLPSKGPGLGRNGNFVLTAFDATVEGQEQPIARAFADHEQPGFPAAATLDGQSKTGWAINVGKGSPGKMNADHEIVFVFAQPLELNGRPIEFRLHHEMNERYLIGRFAFDFAETAPTGPSGPEGALLAALQIGSGQRTAEQTALVKAAFDRDSAGRAKAAKKSKEREVNSDIVPLMIMRDLPQPRPTFLLQRGDYLRPDEKLGPLQPGVLSAVNAAFRNPPADFHNRLDLARWLVNPENPLTPRVTMNRLWAHYFGRGLVETDEDFGSQGSMPTHPELLDWLGREFIRRGWSLKAMHRLIVTSATYRQSSHITPEAMEKDPRNLLLARQTRVRVEGEIVRDMALAASGLLDSTIGGPSVFPPQPEGVYAFTQNKKDWTADTGPARYRRGLYTMYFRSAPYPLLSTFDAPDFSSACTRRGRSDTPLQALTLANDQAFIEIAQGLAVRALQEAPKEKQIERAFLLCLSRPPSPKELSVLTAYRESQAAYYTDDPEGAAKLAPVKIPQNASTADAAAMVCVARVLLNTDSFITRE